MQIALVVTATSCPSLVNVTSHSRTPAPIPFRTNDYTVPFGAFGGLGAVGLTLDRSGFVPADQVLQDQLAAAGLSSFSPVLVTSSAPEPLFCNPNVVATGQCGNTNAGGRTIVYDVRAAALDGTDDGTANYDQVVLFDAGVGVQAGPFSPPSTGPAVIGVGGPSAPFYFEGSGNRVGTSYFIASMAPDLSTVHLVRYSANFIPRNAAVLGDVDDVIVPSIFRPRQLMRTASREDILDNTAACDGHLLVGCRGRGPTDRGAGGQNHGPSMRLPASRGSSADPRLRRDDTIRHRVVPDAGSACDAGCAPRRASLCGGTGRGSYGRRRVRSGPPPRMP